jgi:hypothetical protein
VEISVPRDRDASFEPKIVAKRQRRLAGVGGGGDFAVGPGYLELSRQPGL